MNYDIIPEFDILFKSDRLVFDIEPNLYSVAISLSLWGYLYTEKGAIGK